MGRRVRLYFALSIAAVWAISYLVSVLQNNWTSLSLNTPLMLMAAGYVLGSGLKNGNGNGKGT